MNMHTSYSFATFIPTFTSEVGWTPDVNEVEKPPYPIVTHTPAKEYLQRVAGRFASREEPLGSL
jgi:hypothetical protein